MFESRLAGKALAGEVHAGLCHPHLPLSFGGFGVLDFHRKKTNISYTSDNYRP